MPEDHEPNIPDNLIEEESNPFSLSIGDLMASLLLIFILILASTLLQLRTEIEGYNSIKKNLHQSLYDEFNQDMLKWNMTIDSSTLSIRFKEPYILFSQNQSVIKDSFKLILNTFFPRYISILSAPKYKNYIEEIRIEGHTDNISNYYYNMQLSQERTRSVLMYVLEYTNLADSSTKKWAQSLLTANGLSYSRPLTDNSSDSARSINRRVEFRVRIDAEKKMEEISGR